MFELIENYGFVGEVVISKHETLKLAKIEMDEQFTKAEQREYNVGIRNTETNESV